jgi:hypothetical protein
LAFEERADMKESVHPFRRPLAMAALWLAAAVVSEQAQATLINLDLTGPSGDDFYSTGAGVFGSATSAWNGTSRGSGVGGLALNDDSGAATSVQVSYARLGSRSGLAATGPFTDLGDSSVSSGVVTFTGLTANAAYDLVVYSSWDASPSFSVDAQTRSLVASADWSALVEGTHYVLFHAVADGTGALSFTPLANPGSVDLSDASPWTALQLQTAAGAVPEPVSAALVLLGLALMAGCTRRR